ncbi:hypothetical protein Alches_16140 [Alicyclobacillus hesperidum subsp. aegles]|uniref:hypothetical protein n=1 Tax=Alicyclobacillus hesperidum TaxID=89784 RepID=UPI00222B09A6|nr:hypothetical protein [Alicyclobacillus hesperidum]GLG01574.1 hypothetical protein Alches_16140 [Alicyclobacillus hesperidum subsp. aegles]
MLRSVLSPFAKYGWVFTLLVAISIIFHVHIAQWATISAAVVLVLCIVASIMNIRDRLKG